MQETIFIDSDILFMFFALNEEKINNFHSSGTTGNLELDGIINLINEIESKNQVIYLSEFSILEIVCVLNRLNSSYKTGEILTKIYRICDVLPLNDQMIKLAWYIGSNYTLHSGDALHISFCLFNNIFNLIIKDTEFYNAIINLRTDLKNNGTQNLIDYFDSISFSRGVPDTILRKFNNLNKLKIRKI